jgi:hypothetical protein
LVERVSVVNEKGLSIKNILGVAKETILPRVQRILNTEFVIQRVGKAKPGDDKQVGDNTEIESRGV